MLAPGTDYQYSQCRKPRRVQSDSLMTVKWGIQITEGSLTWEMDVHLYGRQGLPWHEGN